MAEQCFIGPGYIRVLNKTSSFSLIHTDTGTVVGSFSGKPFNGKKGSCVGEIYIPSGDYCVQYPDGWGSEGCNCPPVPALVFTPDLTGGGSGGDPGGDPGDSVDYECLTFKFCDPATCQTVAVKKVWFLPPDFQTPVGETIFDSAGAVIAALPDGAVPCEDCADVPDEENCIWVGHCAKGGDNNSCSIWVDCDGNKIDLGCCDEINGG